VRTPTVTVKDSEGNVLKKGTDYTVTYASGRKDVGTYKVTVKMIGNYSGTKTLSFKINPINISTCTVKLSATELTYNGNVRTPAVTIRNSYGTKLTKDKHYTVTYSEGRKDIGTYKVTIKMIGNYTGQKTLTFKINPIDISTCTVKLAATELTYNGNVRTPAVTVRNSYGTRLTKDKHYTVTYSEGRKDIGTYKVTIKMIGNYTGQKTLTFKINPIDISTCKIYMLSTKLAYNGEVQPAIEIAYNGKEQTPAVKVINSYGTRLTQDKHYTIKYAAGRKNVGTYNVTVKMKGNYTGTATVSFAIKPTIKTSEMVLTGGTLKINAKSNAKITYKSSDKSIAKVSSEGVITGVKAGTVVITVTSNKVSQKITVTVTNPSIKLNCTSKTLGRYSYLKLYATTNPSGATVKWTSSDTAVAKVSSKGKVTPVKTGNCTITASITYGGKTYKATCKVKVINQQPITITDAYWATGMYSEGAEIEPGTALALQIKNNTNKNIKRIELKTTYRDKYAAPAYCVINNTYTKTLKTGRELGGNSRDVFTWEPAIFNTSVSRIDITTVKVIFTDNTTATFDYDMFFYDSDYHYQ
ncbi:MAG: Ig-like domain-containing protein, partial [Clostridia bacterium]|nr:Ig-like domain-containing protein [Clostridia bacterium]